ncbi:MAG: DUF1836 domain-containing protein [Ruminococcaceae bacterium]|jgi:hypothetical protein|nr:DUF1836 domain-containing protein [Oscillospiraceae bacterium]
MAQKKEQPAARQPEQAQPLDRIALPAWEELPDFGVYMDQVVTLLSGYLSFLPEAGESIVSASAINNYVRLKIMPAPVKRKYFRVHLAYLLMILPMKQSISIADIPRILPADADESAVHRAYEDFAGQFRKTADFFHAQVAEVLSGLTGGGDRSGVRRLALESVLVSSFARILAERLIPLQEPPAEEP